VKIAVVCMTLVPGLAGAGAMAQVAGDGMEKAGACSTLPAAERRDCLSRASPHGVPLSRPPPAATAADNWIVSETMSPVDYSPVAIATATAAVSSGGGSAVDTLQFSIRCRGGRSDMVVTGPAITRRAEDYAVTYAVDGGPPVGLAAGALASGSGLALKGDVVRLLASLPDRGVVAFRIAAGQGAVLEARYSLAGLKAVRDRLAIPCRWPAAGAPAK
jgi:hypothetical protein